MDRLRISSEEVEVELLPELGGRLHRLRVFGQDLLRTPGDVTAYRREPFFWGSFVMAPWCNRLPAEPVRMGDDVVHLSPNFPDGTAIHGQVHRLEWTVLADGWLQAEGGDGGWPWRYAVRMRVEVTGPVLTLRLAVTNATDRPMPAGIGIHPWFVGPLEVQIPADLVHPSNQQAEPRPTRVAGPFDLRRLGPMPPDLDATWKLSGAQPVRLHWPGPAIGAVLTAASAPYLCAASPSSLQAVAIEPQTHAPAGLRRLLRGEPGGLHWLGRDDSLELEVVLAFSEGQPPRAAGG